ncbi:shTK domain protein [Onchocerca flexuosa]|uniref:ShTK domain protein n=1 Tax=Onchocerca flexuosa TaxID=387005 RepID=A0A238BVC3_9BILA|nr:shTK domain protein [Onchocerca flexuosa]
MFQLIFLPLLIGTISGTNTGILHSSRSELCYDKDPDCSDDICRNYPYTAKERCPKFCGLCHDSSIGTGGRLSSGFSSPHQQSSSSSLRSGITESITIKKESRSFCVDKNSDCTMEVCRNYPYTAKERCAKTCGLCSENTSSSGTTSGHRTITGIDKFKGEASSSLSTRRGNEPFSSVLCFDKSLDCRRETCRDFPLTSKEECAKTCGYCSGDGAMSSSSSVTAFGTMSPSRHASIRTSDRGGIAGSTISRHSAKHERYDTSPTTPQYSILAKDKELKCIDLNTDCNQQICKDYPYTAKQRCAKTCGFCRKQQTDHSFTDKLRSRTPESDLSSARGSKPSAITGDCRDESPHCSEQSCLDRPYTARTKCAKTCGFCGQSLPGSTIDLDESSSVDNLDRGDVITLDDDNDDAGTTQSTTTFGRHSPSRGGTPTQGSRHSSIGSRTDSLRRPSSSSTFIQMPTNKPFSGIHGRYPGRTGPCVDENSYCEKQDCHKYPRFAQRYCEKTCNYC